MWLAFGTAALALVLLVCCAALVEVFRQLEEIRSALNLADQPIPLSLKSGELRTTDIGLPHQIAVEPRVAIVFLSEKCATCLAIADAFRGGAPDTIWFVVPATPIPSKLLQLLSASTDRIILDENDEIVDRMGLSVTPAVLTAEYGNVTRAQAVSSPRQVLSSIPTVFPLERRPEVPLRTGVADGSDSAAH